MRPRPVLFFGTEKGETRDFWLVPSLLLIWLTTLPVLADPDAPIVRSASTGLHYPDAMRRTVPNQAAELGPLPRLLRTDSRAGHEAGSRSIS